jgi:thymidine kinase
MVGKLEVITGTMFSGKTNELINKTDRYSIRGTNVDIYKSILDNRYATETICTHTGAGRACDSIISSEELLESINRRSDVDVIAIDEVQFLDDVIIHLINYLIKDKIVIASFVDKDCFGCPFKFNKGESEKHVGELLAMADNITYLTAICTYKNEDGKQCNKEATRTQRILDGKPVTEGPLILVGGEEKYQARCKEHFIVKK